MRDSCKQAIRVNFLRNQTFFLFWNGTLWIWRFSYEILEDMVDIDSAFSLKRFTMPPFWHLETPSFVWSSHETSGKELGSWVRQLQKHGVSERSEHPSLISFAPLQISQYCGLVHTVQYTNCNVCSWQETENIHNLLGQQLIIRYQQNVKSGQQTIMDFYYYILVGLRLWKQLSK